MQHKSPDRGRAQPEGGAELKKGLARLAQGRDASWHLPTRLRNYFLTGLLVVGPVTITIYIAWWFINVVDAWIKPFLPGRYNPETYLPFAVPGVGLLFSILGLTLVGALAANLLGRTLISYGDLMLGRMPIVRNVYRTMQQIFESVITASGPNQPVQKVGLIEFPSKGLWSLVFVTGETAAQIKALKPGGEDDLISVFIPTGIVPPTGFVCFVPRKSVTPLEMNMEDAAKIIISGGMVTPEQRMAGRGPSKITPETVALAVEQPTTVVTTPKVVTEPNKHRPTGKGRRR